MPCRQCKHPHAVHPTCCPPLPPHAAVYSQRSKHALPLEKPIKTHSPASGVPCVLLTCGTGCVRKLRYGRDKELDADTWKHVQAWRERFPDYTRAGLPEEL